MPPIPPFTETDTSWTRIRISSIKYNEHAYDRFQRSALLAPGPRRVGHFSLTGVKPDRIFHNSNMRSLRKLNSSFYRAPEHDMQPVPLDCEGGRIAVQRGEPLARGQDQGFHKVLKWILAHRMQFDEMRQTGEVRFVGQGELFRRNGVMRSISYNWQYERGWLLAACRFQGVIYIAEFSTDKKLDLIKAKNEINAAATGDHADEHKRAVKQEAMARMFQHVMLAPPPNNDKNKPPEDADPPKFDEKCCVMMLLPLKSTSSSNLGFLYNAILSGYDEQFGGPDAAPHNCYNCRSIRKPTNEWYEKQFIKPKKYPDWWSNCYASGERGVILGYRDVNDAVVKCTEVTNEQMENANTFELADIIGCLRDVLEELAGRVVKADCDKFIYLLRWAPEGALSPSGDLREISVASVDANKSEYQVLPKWFTDKMTKPEDEAEVVLITNAA